MPVQVDAGGWASRVRHDIEQAVREAGAADGWLTAHPPRFTWDTELPPAEVESGHPLVHALTASTTALGRAPRRRLPSRGATAHGRQPEQPPHWHGPPDWQPHPQPDPQPQAASTDRCTTSVGASCWGSLTGESAMLPPRGVRAHEGVRTWCAAPTPLDAHSCGRINGAHMQNTCATRAPGGVQGERTPRARGA
ncbi:hypothetical protein ACFT7S_30065 [Streptomyces sp. NPDC057136]|uniref:hypothetical protein n=1 Tax=Streptomyces sp. NPDC057136 TaxID=3346029 RepID=UPI0036279C0D